jgi:glutamyl-Q tRNA(Asp) synthetase
MAHSESKAVVRGRFAPSPSGPLHFGSLVAAVGSFVHARAQGGEWLLRIEDLDPPREAAGAADDIRRTLEAHGLAWDGPVLYQSRRHERYAQALDELVRAARAYPCACTRREIADAAVPGIDGPVYPGTCRDGIAPGRAPRSWRVRCLDAEIAFDDEHYGRLRQDVARRVGDFVLKRADGLYAYQLAVVVDDADQGVTEVVRGADLLDSTARQIMLQRLLGLPTPRYMHLPLAVDAAGEKLSKQTLAPRMEAAQASRNLAAVLRFLGQDPPAALARERPASILGWALAHWAPRLVPGGRTAPACMAERPSAPASAHH